MKDSRNRATRNRQIRQEALRDQLSSQGHVQHVIDLIDKIQDVSGDIDNNDKQAFKMAAELRMKLINKYLPDLKSTDLNVSGQLDTGKDFTDLPEIDKQRIHDLKRQLINPNVSPNTTH